MLENLRYCKIVATLGPASNSPEKLQLLTEAGVNVFRLNMSHGNHEAHSSHLLSIRSVEKNKKRPICVFADLQGPKIRVGKLPNGGVDLKIGSKWTVVCEQETDEPATIPLPHEIVVESLRAEDILLFDDGKLAAKVIDTDTGVLQIQITVPGYLSDNKGVNLPGRRFPISALTEKDKHDAEFALAKGVDYLALSFVQHPDDIHEIKTIAAGRAGIIAKIEKPSALEYLEEIIELADAIMVARGDLGVELPLEQVPIAQRRIIALCRKHGKPVIVATQMLESMISSPVPTRAETSDVANAVYQGADAVMLSAESAVGIHPQTAVAVMDRIIRANEAPESGESFIESRKYIATDANYQHSSDEAISLAARNISDVLNCKLAIPYTMSGSTALRIAQARPKCPIIALTPQKETARRLALVWGVYPIITPDAENFEEMLAKANRHALGMGLEPGDQCLITAGIPFGHSGTTNLINIATIKMD